jgi:hypothetical protein
MNQRIQGKLLNVLFNKKVKKGAFFHRFDEQVGGVELICTDQDLYFSKKLKPWRKVMEKKFKGLKFWIVYCSQVPNGYV